MDDLVQAGAVGLLDAIIKFDPHKSVPFGAYAKIRIRGAIIDSLRDFDWAGRGLRSQGRKVEDTEQQLRAKYGRFPTEDEMAKALNLTLTHYRRLKADLESVKLISIDQARLAWDDETLSEPTASDVTYDPYDSCLRSEMNSRLHSAIKRLPHRQQFVVMKIYDEELRVLDIAETLKVKSSRVSQIHTAAKETLRILLSA